MLPVATQTTFDDLKLPSIVKKNSSAARLVIVSNRVADNPAGRQSGGLAVALGEALAHTGGLWFGWSGEVDPAAHVKSADVRESGGLTRATVGLTEDERQGYYLGFANGCLWPAFHYRLDLMSHRPAEWQHYLSVNARFARELMPLLGRDDLVWIHDFHLIPLGEELRKLGWDGPLGFFLHTPFPSAEVFGSIPVHRDLARALMAHDVIGFQTKADRLNFVQAIKQAGGREMHGGCVQAFGRRSLVSAFPIGIDVKAVSALAASGELPVPSASGAQQLIVGVDRLDYTKGIPERLLGFERLLERDASRRGKVSLLQIAPPTRGGVPGYAELTHQVQQLVGRINGRFGTLDWVPVTFINRAFPRRELLRLFRAAQVGLVTPLRDGMNLVAKEFVAAQDSRDPGVLVLSRFAGAAEELKAALPINPHDADSVAAALGHALDMPLTQRQVRDKWLRAQVMCSDVATWRASYLQALSSVGKTSDEMTDSVMVGAA